MITPEEIKSLRISLKLTQVELAGYLGYSKSHVCMIESGERTLDTEASERVIDIMQRLVSKGRNGVANAQIVLNSIKNRRDCEQSFTNDAKNTPVKWGELLK